MEIKDQYDSQFYDVLQQLNSAQTEAVNQIDGPVLVVAGPGTGKTQILSARIGNILKTTDAQPHNILCLTYTDAGTIAMRKRLNDFIGPAAYNVHIFTFHAFCNKVIQENLEFFGIRELQPISDIEQIELLHELVDSFDVDHPLKRFSGDTYFEVNRLRSLFSTMKQEGWTGDLIEEKALEYLDDLPNRKEFVYQKNTKQYQKGDLKPAKYNPAKKRTLQLIAAAKEFNRYEKMMTQKGRYDYNDMILWVLNAFTQNDELLLNYQEQYHYFLVDEYQDTNGAQNNILTMLSSYWDIPNVFVVGDDDQSIFRFQGANIQNIAGFYSRYKEGLKSVVLTENYRSSQQVLDIAKICIENNEERLVNVIPGLTKELNSAGTNKNVEEKVQLVRCQNTYQEELFVLKKIEELKADGQSLDNVAVLYRNHKEVDRLVKLCVDREIPINIKKRVNILDLPFVQQLLNVLKFIEEAKISIDRGAYLLFDLMHFEIFHIPSLDVLKIARACQGEEKKNWLLFISNKRQLEKYEIEKIDAVLAFSDHLTYWIQQSENYTLQGLFEQILTKANVLDYVMNHPERMWLMQVITTFFDFIKNESVRNPKIKIEELLEIIAKQEDFRIPIAVNKAYLSEEGVHFMTAHSSKGLEFEHVFVIGCATDRWEKKRGMVNGYSIPDTLTFSLAENKEEEERRLFYVAITRAEKYLYLTYPMEDENGKEKEPSKFIVELGDHPAIEKIHASFPNETTLDYFHEVLKQKSPPSLPLLDTDLIDASLKNFKMSVTALNKYLDCPLKFYFETIIRVPSARNANMGFGSAVHYALEHYFLEMNDHPQKKFGGAEQLLLLFKKGMDIYRSNFTLKEYATKLEYSEKILPSYLEKYESQWNTITTLEYEISHVHLEGVPLTGKLDKLEFNDKQVNVVDYKTGRPDSASAKSKLGPNTDRKPLGGDYWRQMVFYKILMDLDTTKNWEMVSGEMDFIQPNAHETFEKRKYVISPEDVALVSEQITSSYKKIMNHEFAQGCGKEDCQWCNFVRDNFNGDSLDLSAINIEDE